MGSNGVWGQGVGTGCGAEGRGSERHRTSKGPWGGGRLEAHVPPPQSHWPYPVAPWATAGALRRHVWPSPCLPGGGPQEGPCLAHLGAPGLGQSPPALGSGRGLLCLCGGRDLEGALLSPGRPVQPGSWPRPQADQDVRPSSLDGAGGEGPPPPSLVEWLLLSFPRRPGQPEWPPAPPARMRVARW